MFTFTSGPDDLYLDNDYMIDFTDRSDQSLTELEAWDFLEEELEEDI